MLPYLGLESNHISNVLWNICGFKYVQKRKLEQPEIVFRDTCRFQRGFPQFEKKFFFPKTEERTCSEDSRIIYVDETMINITIYYSDKICFQINGKSSNAVLKIILRHKT